MIETRPVSKNRQRAAFQRVRSYLWQRVLAFLALCLLVTACKPAPSATVLPAVATIAPTKTLLVVQPTQPLEAPPPSTPFPLVQTPDHTAFQKLIATCEQDLQQAKITDRLNLQAGSVYFLINHNDTWSEQFILPATPLRTTDPARASYVVCVTQLDTQTGTYSDGQPSYRVQWKVKLINLVEKTILYVNQLQGSEPELIKTHEGPGYGQLPSAQLVSWVNVWEELPITARKQIKTLEGSQETCISMVFTPEGQRLISGNGNGRLFVWDIAGGSPQELKGHTGEINGLSVNLDGKLLAAVDRNYLMTIWDLATLQQVRSLYVSNMPSSVALTPDGKLVAAGTVAGHILVYDTATSEELYEFGQGEMYSKAQLVFSPDGKRLAGSVDGQFAITWDMSTGDEISRYLVEDQVVQITLFNDGQNLALVTVTGEVIIWNPDGSILSDYKTGESIHVAAFSPGGELLATEDGSGRIKLWDLQTGQPSDILLTGQSDLIETMAFTPDGQQLASCSYYSEIFLWDVGK